MNFGKKIRLPELVVLFYRLFLVFFFYQIARALFWFFNQDLVKIASLSDYLRLAYYGVAFDTTAVFYVNSLFVLLSLLPIIITTKPKFQNFLLWFYFTTNALTFVLNFIDFVYFKFSQGRLTNAVFALIQNDSNVLKVLQQGFFENLGVAILYSLCLFFWVILYKKVKQKEQIPRPNALYFVSSIVSIGVIGTLIVGGIRGDFKHSTRPINMVDANRHVLVPVQANVVLNSVFSFFRTWDTNQFKQVHLVSDAFVENNISAYKFYNRGVSPKPNVVVFIMESFGREYSGAFNRETKIKNYVSYTPFLDSLASESLIASQAYANGRQSIHAMSSILAGIPTLADAFTSSPYANQKIQSIVSVANDMGYDTSFFHGAPNGSMGFQGFGNILGFQHYYGKTEFANDAQFDGIWGIWDEPFFQYFAETLNHKKTPFFSTLFSVSSHHPYKIPDKYKGKFKKGDNPMHMPVQYSDEALKAFFSTAKKMPWYQNTIFVVVADHPNLVHYAEYEKAMNRFAVPILFYSPNPKFGLRGDIKTPTQQLDIYPTLADLMGYNRKIRSWGRSLVSQKHEQNIVVNHSGVSHFIIGNYIYIFDGKNTTAIYKNTDLGFEKNEISSLKTREIEQGKELVKAWYQNYMDRIMNKKLD